MPYIISFNLITLFYTCVSQETERLSELLMFTQLQEVKLEKDWRAELYPKVVAWAPPSSQTAPHTQYSTGKMGLRRSRNQDSWAPSIGLEVPSLSMLLRPFYFDTIALPSPPQNSPIPHASQFYTSLPVLTSLVLNISRFLIIKPLELRPECFKEGMRCMAFSFLGPPLTVTSRFLNLEWVLGLAPPACRPNSVPLLGG